MNSKKIILILLFISFNLCSDSARTKWSANLGKLTWSDANTKCAELKMRLPTLDELKKGYDSNELESWKQEGNTYWTANEISKERASYFTLLNGVSFSLAKDKTILARCILK
ncbi:MAG: hypothetical protein KBA66_09955 [Leptospiraceae bacterium]|nr:hypothetical protein [Leptospiraceae bacterium]